jgi:WD repeat-containing protein 35
MQLMRKETDDRPILVDTGMTIKSVKWNPNGNVLAVAGSYSDSNSAEGKGTV